MADLIKVLFWIVAAYAATIRFLYWFAATSSPFLGYLLLAIAAAIKFYQKRWRFYIDRQLDGDWEPTYGKMIRNRMFDSGLGITCGIVVILGVLTLLHAYLPDAFEGLFGMLLIK